MSPVIAGILQYTGSTRLGSNNDTKLALLGTTWKPLGCLRAMNVDLWLKDTVMAGRSSYRDVKHYEQVIYYR